MGDGAVTRFSLDGAMIPRQVKRLFDARSEPRDDAGGAVAGVDFRGERVPVRIINVSPSGAMLALGAIPNIGERIVLHRPGEPKRPARVLWVRGGRIGIHFLGRSD